MIQKPKQVCLIYGGAGKRYAHAIAERIQHEECETRTPITATLILEQILTGDLVGGLMHIVRNSDLFIIFLTAEDIGGPSTSKLKSRVRQNVLLEIGMALYAAGDSARDKLILVSDVENLEQLDIPSDLSSFSIKSFDRNSFDAFSEELIKKILGLLLIQSRRNLLADKRYCSRYRELFVDSDPEVFLYSGSNQLQIILDHWLQDCKTISRFDQKAIFVLERLPFFPIFGRHKRFVDWLHKIHESVQIGDHDDSGLQIDAMSVLSLCLEHTESRINIDPDAAEHTHHAIGQAFESVIARLSKSDTLNPILKLCAYDYYGLTCLKLFHFSSDPLMLERAQRAFRVCIETIRAQDANPGFWQGYLEYNLSRVHRELYKLGKGNEHAEEAERLLGSAVLIRKKWVRISEYLSPSLKIGPRITGISA